MNNACDAPLVQGDVSRSGPDEGTVIGILRAADALQEKLEAALVKVGLSISKFDALEQLLAAGSPLTLGELAGCLHCVRSNVTQLVDRLEADGLVKRGSCPQDRRAIRAMVTPIGLERHAAGVTAIRSVQLELAERLNAKQRAELQALLEAAIAE